MLLPTGGSKRIKGGIPRIDWSNSITEGLSGVWLFGLGPLSVGPVNLVTGRSANQVNYSDAAPNQFSASNVGVGVLNNQSSYFWFLGLANVLYGQSISIGATSRFGAGTLTNSFGDDVMGVLLPYVDNNVYFDFPDAGTGRISFAYTPTNKVDNWLLTSGPGTPGKTAWLNGVRQFSGSAATTDTGSPTGNFVVGVYPAAGVFHENNVEHYLFATWRRKLTDPEAQSFTVDPFKFLIWPDDDIFNSQLQLGLAGYYLRPDTDSSDGGWLNQVGSSADLFSSVDEIAQANDADYIVSSTNPVADIIRMGLSDPAVPLGNSTVKVRYRYKGTGAVGLTVRLMQGVSTIATWTHSDVSSGFVTAEQILTAPELASISDFTDLFIEFQADST